MMALPVSQLQKTVTLTQPAVALWLLYDTFTGIKIRFIYSSAQERTSGTSQDAGSRTTSIHSRELGVIHCSIYFQVKYKTQYDAQTTEHLCCTNAPFQHGPFPLLYVVMTSMGNLGTVTSLVILGPQMILCSEACGVWSLPSRLLSSVKVRWERSVGRH